MSEGVTGRRAVGRLFAARRDLLVKLDEARDVARSLAAHVRYHVEVGSPEPKETHLYTSFVAQHPWLGEG